MPNQPENSQQQKDAQADHAAAIALVRDWLAELGQPALNLDTLRPGPVTAPSPDGIQPHFRVDGADGQTAYLAIATGAATSAYERASAVFVEAGLAAPAVVAAGPAHVLALDPSPLSYLHQLNLDSAHQLHMDAIGALLALQGATKPDVLPVFGRERMAAELALFTDHFLTGYLGVTPTARQAEQLDKVLTGLLDQVAAQERVHIHRNFQARNLLVLPGTPGILDVGSAAMGPAAYDLVSLLRDPLNAWDEEMVLDWAVRYWQAARQAGLPIAQDIDDFYRDFELAGVQRHLMQLGLYARMVRQGQGADVAADIPQLLEFVRKAGHRYSLLKPLVKLLDDWEERQPQVGYTF